MSPADRVVVDWRISEYELVDANEASLVDKAVVLFSSLCNLSDAVDTTFSWSSFFLREFSTPSRGG